MQRTNMQANAIDLKKIIDVLKSNNLFDKEYFEKIHHNKFPRLLALAIEKLQQAHIVNKDVVEDILLLESEESFINVPAVYIYFHKKNIILTKEIRESVKKDFDIFYYLINGLAKEDEQIILRVLEKLSSHKNFSEAIRKLGKNNILNKETLTDILALEDEKLKGVARVYVYFNLAHIPLTQINRQCAMVFSDDKRKLSDKRLEFLQSFKNKKLDTLLFLIENIISIAKFNSEEQPDDIALLSRMVALIKLNAEGILTIENSELIKADSEPDDLVQKLLKLHKAGISIKDNIEFLKQYPWLDDMIDWLIKLHNAGILLTEASRKFVSTYYSLDGSFYIDCLIDINQLLHLTEKEQTIIIQHDYAQTILAFGHDLKSFTCLDKENFDLIIHYSELLASEMIQALFRDIAIEKITKEFYQEFFKRLKAAPDALQAQHTLTVFMQGFSQLTEDKQSTHTTSIHATAAKSAKKLFRRYGNQIDTPTKIDEKLKEIQNWANALPEQGEQEEQNEKNSGAKKVIKVLTASDNDQVDAISKVPVRILLILVYLAIHDDKKRHPKTSIEGVERLLIEGFYEMQKNVDEHTVKKGEPQKEELDKTIDLICGGGWFNKLLEKLVGIHPDVQLDFVSPVLASFKLPKVVQEEAINYLSSYANANTETKPTIGVNEDGLGKFFELVQGIEQEGMSTIWLNIKEKVAKRLFDEFGSLYKIGENAPDPNNPKFLTFVETGIYTSFDQHRLQKIISTSKGYENYCSSLLFWSGHFSFRTSLLSQHEKSKINSSKVNNKL